MDLITHAIVVSGDLATAVGDGFGGLKAEYLLVAPAAIIVGAVPFGVKKLWRFSKNLI